MQSWFQLYIDIWKVIPYLQANVYCLKVKKINSLIFISTIIKQLVLIISFVFKPVYLRKKGKGLAVY